MRMRRRMRVRIRIRIMKNMMVIMTISYIVKVDGWVCMCMNIDMDAMDEMNESLSLSFRD